jgi:hypothetical protein
MNVPDWFVPLLALLALSGFLYFAFVRTKPAPRSANDPGSGSDLGGGGGGGHHGD